MSVILSHHTSWGYAHDNEAGEQLTAWGASLGLHLLHNPKDSHTFWSARWRKGYNPDLTFSTVDVDGIPAPSIRRVCSDFPNSQHRPIITEIGLSISTSPSPGYARWNLKKADWVRFSETVEKTIVRIPPSVQNIDRATRLILKAATSNIPRGHVKKYVPGWSEKSENLLKSYQDSKDPETGKELLKSLDENRKNKWVECVENINFTHSSKKAWNLLGRLSGEKTGTAHSANIGANHIADKLIENSKGEIDRQRKTDIKKDLRNFMRSKEVDNQISSPVNVEEVDLAIQSAKPGKAAGPDGILPEFLHNLGPHARKWLAIVYSDIIETGALPKRWKHAKVVAILKPGKTGEDASHYRPITLLCVLFKALERILLGRIADRIEESVPVEQAGFRSGRSCCDQVLALASHIEFGFDKRQKSGAAFIDLSAAYDTVWKHGLVFKLSRVVPCTKVARLIWNILSNRTLEVNHRGEISKHRILNNGLPQGSVLAPILFNVYIADMPNTRAQKFQYADDTALLAQASTFSELEDTLNADLLTLENYFKSWRLKPNPSKTTSACFHLNNKQATTQLELMFCNSPVRPEKYPTYLGVTLDRTLSYKTHLAKVAAKTSTRVSIINKLAGTTWGASADVLRISTLSLVYSTAEYCAPVWAASKHTSLVDTQLNRAMRTISGSLKPTNTLWLPTLSNIQPADLRRDAATLREYNKIMAKPQLPIHDSHILTKRLKSRNPFWERGAALNNKPFDINLEWQRRWISNPPPNGNLVDNPTKRVEGFDLNRKSWTTLNRFRTNQGRCQHLMHRWGLSPSDSCECGDVQSMRHIVEDCPLRKLHGGIASLHSCSAEAVSWLRNLDLNI